MDLTKKIDELGSAWEEYKKTNNAAIEKQRTESSETKEKLEKIDTDLDKLQEEVKALNAAMTRIGQGGQNQVDEKKQKLEEYKKQFEKYVRKGSDISHEMNEFAMKTLSVDSDVNGGFFVEPQMSAEIVKSIHESSPIRQLASVQTISSASLKLNSDLDKPLAYPVAERGSRTVTTNPTVKQNEIFAHEYYCEPQATQSFLDDAAINVEAWLSAYAAEAFALAEATDMVSGNGVGKIRGILSYTDGTTYGYIQRVATDATGAITGLDLIDVQDSLKEGYQRNASWLMNRLTRSVVRKATDGTQYLWQPGLQAGVPDMLLGKPVYLAADLNTSLVTGTDGLMMYGDFRAGYQVVDRVGIRLQRDPYTSKPNVIFYTTKRVGGAVKNFEAIKVLKIT